MQNETELVGPTLAPAQIECKPGDSRCRYWAKLIKRDALAGLDPGSIDGANSLPGAYLRAGADVVLEPGDLLIAGEENHHRKQHGWTIRGLLCVRRGSAKRPGQYALADVIIGAARKAEIIRTRPDLKGGSGDHAAIVRSARFALQNEGVCGVDG